MSEVKVNKISPRSGTTVTLGDSGDTIAIASGASLSGFTSTGIDDNASSTAVTILSSGYVGIGQTNPTTNFHVGDDSAGTENTSIRIEGGSTSGYSQVHFADSGDVNVGRVQYTHSSNTMALYTNDTEAMRIDSSGNVLVGMTSASVNNTGFYALGAGGASTTRAGATPLNVNRQTDDGTIISLRKDGTEVGSIKSADGVRLVVDSIADGKLSRNGTEVVTWTSDSFRAVTDDSYDLGRSTTRWQDLYLSGNIYLGGTGSANALDDYEEGTFSPTISGTTGGPSGVNFTTRAGFYTKIGDMVHFDIHLNLASWGSGPSGNVIVANLPFTSNSSSGYDSSVAIGLQANFSQGVGGGQVVTNTNYVFLRKHSSADARSSTSSSIASSEVSGNETIFISGAYKTS